jgi:signal transduction histidine kinase
VAFAAEPADLSQYFIPAFLERVQRPDLVGRLASGLAHDLNNLLTVVRASVEALGGPEANADLAAIEDAAQRADASRADTPPSRAARNVPVG